MAWTLDKDKYQHLDSSCINDKLITSIGKINYFYIYLENFFQLTEGSCLAPKTLLQKVASNGDWHSDTVENVKQRKTTKTIIEVDFIL